jgi:hypothetical protein
VHGAPKALDRPQKTIHEQVATETEKMVALARRVRKRLEHHLYQTADARSIPGEEFISAARWYQKTIIELKRFLVVTAPPSTQRLHLGMGGQHDEKPLTQELYDAEIRTIVLEQLREYTPDQRRELLREAGLDEEAIMREAGIPETSRPVAVEKLRAMLRESSASGRTS